jgi:hypothetical protein
MRFCRNVLFVAFAIALVFVRAQPVQTTCNASGTSGEWSQGPVASNDACIELIVCYSQACCSGCPCGISTSSIGYDPNTGLCSGTCSCACGGGGSGGGEEGGGDPYEAPSPIVVHLEAGRPKFSDAEHGVLWDFEGQGRAVRAGWPLDPASTGWLALDRNGNGRIDNGTELFGNHTPLLSGATASHGYQALAEYDLNHDGWIDRADPIYDQLVFWRDLNRDGRSSPAEMTGLKAVGIRRISVEAKQTDQLDRWGNQFRYRAPIVVGDEPEVRFSWDVFVVTAPSGVIYTTVTNVH